jgi:hypothetical protein
MSKGRSRRTAARRRASFVPRTTSTQPATLSPEVARAVAGVIEQLREDDQTHASFEIVVRVRHEGSALPTMLADDVTVPAVTKAARSGVMAPPVDPLAIGPVTAAAALLAKRPFRRHIEGSRPVIVLGEGVRMINAHPLALMVFWGGLATWVLGAILAGHHLAPAARMAVLGSVMAGCVVATLARIGKLTEARASTRALRMALADPAGRARAIGLLVGTRRPDAALLGAAVESKETPAAVSIATTEDKR